MITGFSGRFNSFPSSYRFIIYLDCCSFKGVDSVSLQVTSKLYVHGFIMMSPLFNANKRVHWESMIPCLFSGSLPFLYIKELKKCFERN